MPPVTPFQQQFICCVSNMLQTHDVARAVEKTRIGYLVLAYFSAMRRLVIRPGGIGDFIVSLPALECLRTDDFEVWTTSRTVPLVQFADRVRSIASTGIEQVGVTDPPGALLIEHLRSFDSI